MTGSCISSDGRYGFIRCHRANLDNLNINFSIFLPFSANFEGLYLAKQGSYLGSDDKHRFTMS